MNTQVLGNQQPVGKFFVGLGESCQTPFKKTLTLVICWVKSNCLKFVNSVSDKYLIVCAFLYIRQVLYNKMSVLSKLCMRLFAFKVGKWDTITSGHFRLMQSCICPLLIGSLRTRADWSVTVG